MRTYKRKLAHYLHVKTKLRLCISRELKTGPRVFILLLFAEPYLRFLGEAAMYVRTYLLLIVNFWGEKKKRIPLDHYKPPPPHRSPSCLESKKSAAKG